MSETHDFTKRVWGHDVSLDVLPDSKLKLVGWKKGIKLNDYVILPNGQNTTRYQISKIEYFADPSDMFRAIAEFAPRSNK